MVRTLKNYVVIKEYDSLVRGGHASLPANYVSLPEKTFDELENFVISHKSESGVEALELLSISSKRGIGKVISAKNYVGLIQMKDGTQIEILPKIYTRENDHSVTETRKIFLNMLKSLKDSPFKSFNHSSLGTAPNNLFEIFIRMFINETRELIKKGLRSNYIGVEENEKFFKGKLLINEQIKRNMVHKERFFVSYDLFHLNRPENKLIKATLIKLLKTSTNSKNIKDMEKLLVAFEMVDVSVHYEKDFMSIKADRSTKGYEFVLLWSKIFLMNKSFTTFAGANVAYALLFPMEKIFEAYMGNVIRKHFGASNKVILQDRFFYLFDEPRKFNLQPDIVLKIKDSIIIMDTKWKLLSPSYTNHAISQADMYQMYVYSKKYNARKTCMLYPLHEGLTANETSGLSYLSHDGVKVEIIFVDLQQMARSIERIAHFV